MSRGVAPSSKASCSPSMATSPPTPTQKAQPRSRRMHCWAGLWSGSAMKTSSRVTCFGSGSGSGSGAGSGSGSGLGFGSGLGLDILDHQVVGLRAAQRELTARLLRGGTGRGVELGIPGPGEGWGEGEGEGSARDSTGRGAELGAEAERVLKRGIPLASSASLALVALAARVGAACVVRAGPRAELVNEAEEEHHRRVRDMHLEARGRRGGSAAR